MRQPALPNPIHVFLIFLDPRIMQFPFPQSGGIFVPHRSASKRIRPVRKHPTSNLRSWSSFSLSFSILDTEQVAANPGDKPAVDLVVVRENTECLASVLTLRVVALSVSQLEHPVRQTRNPHHRRTWQRSPCNASHHRTSLATYRQNVIRDCIRSSTQGISPQTVNSSNFVS